jgi:hypothetical protein
MVHITLFLPDSGPLEYDVKSHTISENGVLHFRVDDKSLGATTDVSTSVPFLVRNPVADKGPGTLPPRGK